ncbi:MAG TPA: response regulator [Candidatus Binatia bacterium]|jgi:two-component system cell cycle response regulator DivK
MNKKILVVEDNNDSREMMNGLITKMGYRAIAAKNSYEAIALAESERPQLILMDMQLPDVDGFKQLPCSNTIRKPLAFLS